MDYHNGIRIFYGQSMARRIHWGNWGWTKVDDLGSSLRLTFYNNAFKKLILPYSNRHTSEMIVSKSDGIFISAGTSLSIYFKKFAGNPLYREIDRSPYGHGSSHDVRHSNSLFSTDTT